MSCLHMFVRALLRAQWEYAELHCCMALINLAACAPRHSQASEQTHRHTKWALYTKERWRRVKNKKNNWVYIQGLNILETVCSSYSTCNTVHYLWRESYSKNKNSHDVPNLYDFLPSVEQAVRHFKESLSRWFPYNEPRSLWKRPAGRFF